VGNDTPRAAAASFGPKARAALCKRAFARTKSPSCGGTGSAASRRIAAFGQRLRELGWVEGRTVAIEYRWAEGRSERLAEFAADFVRLKVDVIVAGGTPATVAAKQATSVAPSRCLEGLGTGSVQAVQAVLDGLGLATTRMLPQLTVGKRVFA
jgi:hypothetical protein